MLTILTPSKTMNFADEAPDFAAESTILFPEQATVIRDTLRLQTEEQLRQAMSISGPLAEKTTKLFAQTVQKQALWSYVGDVFKGFQARSIDAVSADFAQKHLLVPSGMYGLVRPYDMISPYRLEMKTKVAIGGAKDLYAFWGSTLGEYVDKHAKGSVLFLSSAEYIRAIQPFLRSETRVVVPAFIDRKPDGTESQVAIYNKMMRGAMARWIVDSKIDSLEEITRFAAHQYSYSSERSTYERPVFYREHMIPLVFPEKMS